jgi:hypothetical protein
MKSWLEQFIEEQASVQYCPYCLEERNNKRVCCSEIHFLEFRDLDDDTQRQIAMDEWEANHKDYQ